MLKWILIWNDIPNRRLLYYYLTQVASQGVSVSKVGVITNKAVFNRKPFRVTAWMAYGMRALIREKVVSRPLRMDCFRKARWGASFRRAFQGQHLYFHPVEVAAPSGLVPRKAAPRRSLQRLMRILSHPFPPERSPGGSRWPQPFL